MTPPQNEAVPSTSPRLSDRRRALVEGVTSALIVYVIAGGSEEALVRILRPTQGELTWISDVVTAAAFGVAVYLWRHLRATRLQLSQRERDELVLQTQLTLAASNAAAAVAGGAAAGSRFRVGGAADSCRSNRRRLL